MDSLETQEYNSLLREIGKLKEEIKNTNAKQLEKQNSLSRFVELVLASPDPLCKNFYTDNLPSTKRPSWDMKKENKRVRSIRWSKKIEPVERVSPTMDSLVWAIVFSFLDYFSLCAVCTVCKRFNEIMHTAMQQVMDEQTCLHLWYKRLESVPKVSPWVPSPNAIMPLYVFPSFGFSFKSKEKKIAIKVHKGIEAEIKKQRRKKSRVLLVIGPPEAGKSTFVYNHIYPLSNLDVLTEPIREYTITAMKEFLDEDLVHVKPEEVNLSTIASLWQDQKIQHIYFQNLESKNSTNNAHYFFENAETIAAPNYKPTKADLRHFKFRETYNFTEHTKQCNDLTYNIAMIQDFDENARFYHTVFSNVDVVYLCISLLNFDSDQERYIREVVNREFFYTKCIVVLTKLDLFQAQIQNGGKISNSIKTILEETNLLAGTTDMSTVLNNYVRQISSNTLRSVIFLNNLEETAPT